MDAKTVRIGIIGCGNMGGHHARAIHDGKVTGASLGAVCDTDPTSLKRISDYVGGGVPVFEEAKALIDSGTVDAAIVATPHYDHPGLSIAAMQAGLHVLCEKPAGVYTRQVREMNEVAAESGLIFALMYNQRTMGIHRKLKDVLEAGELGDLKRNSWVVTDWYRSQSYYDSGGWRATWAGEGGGVLMNQCPHQLDMWQWFCGMPKRVRAFCSFGKYHNIEVDDDVTIFVEYPDGSTGTFISSTGEAPGTNRFEIAGDMGRIVMENGTLVFNRNRVPERTFNSEFKGGFGSPESWRCEIPVRGGGEQHIGVMKQFVKAITANDPGQLVARGEEGIHCVELINAALLSAWTDDWVDLPLDEDLFYEKLQERIKTSTFEKASAEKVQLAVDGTF